MAHPKQVDLYAGLRYVAARDIRGLDHQLYEHFTTARRGKLARKIKEACFEALMQTAKNDESLARFFVELSKYPEHRSNSDYIVDAVSRAGAVGFETAFDVLQECEDGDARFRVALLIAKASKTRRPRSATFWKTASADELDAVIREWKTLLVRRGLVRPSALSAARSTEIDEARAGAEASKDP